MEPQTLRAMIQQRIERGSLPREKCLVTWFGPGSGRACDACSRLIGKHEIECECEHPRGGVLRFHQACFAIWDQQRGDEVVSR